MKKYKSIFREAVKNILYYYDNKLNKNIIAVISKSSFSERDGWEFLDKRKIDINKIDFIEFNNEVAKKNNMNYAAIFYRK